MGLISLMSLLLKSNFILKRVNYFNDAAVWCYDPPAHYFTELFFHKSIERTLRRPSHMTALPNARFFIEFRCDSER